MVKKVHGFPRSRTRQECLLSPFLFRSTLKVLASEIRQEKYTEWNRRSKNIFTTNNIIYCLFRKSLGMHKLLELMSLAKSIY